MSAAAIIMKRRRALVRRFQDLGAVDAAHAITLAAAGVKPSWIFEQMQRRGVFVALPEERFFLDEPGAAAFFGAHRARVLMFAAILLLSFLLLWACGFLR